MVEIPKPNRSDICILLMRLRLVWRKSAAQSTDIACAKNVLRGAFFPECSRNNPLFLMYVDGCALAQNGCVLV